MRKITALLIILASMAVPVLSQGVTTSIDLAGRSVIMENSKLKVRWGDFSGGKETAIMDFIIKSTGVDQAGSYIDAGAGRAPLSHASIIEETADYTTIRLGWGGALSHFTMFKDKDYLRIDYFTYGVNIVDIGSPGGGTGQYIFYGGDQWKRGYVTYEKCYYYPNSDQHCVDVTGMPGDDGPGSLDYNGWFIMGVYNSTNNQGFGRLSPVEHTTIIKLLFNKGFEIFPHFNETHVPYTGWLFAVTGGAAEVLSKGKMFAGLALPDVTPPGLDTVVSLSATQTRVVFDEEVDAAVAVLDTHYRISRGTVVTKAELQADGKTVILTHGTLSGGINYKLSVINMKDLAGNVEDYLYMYFMIAGSGIGDHLNGSLPSHPIRLSGNPWPASADLVVWSGDRPMRSVSLLDTEGRCIDHQVVDHVKVFRWRRIGCDMKPGLYMVRVVTPVRVWYRTVLLTP